MAPRKGIFYLKDRNGVLSFTDLYLKIDLDLFFFILFISKKFYLFAIFE